MKWLHTKRDWPVPVGVCPFPPHFSPLTASLGAISHLFSAHWRGKATQIWAKDFSTEETDPGPGDCPLITTFWDPSDSQLLAHLAGALLMCDAFFPHWNTTLCKSNILQACCICSYVYGPASWSKRMTSSWYNKTPVPENHINWHFLNFCYLCFCESDSRSDCFY